MNHPSTTMGYSLRRMCPVLHPTTDIMEHVDTGRRDSCLNRRERKGVRKEVDAQEEKC